MEKILVNVNDKFGDSCFKDSVVNSDIPASRKPEGFVEIFEVQDNGKLKKKHGKSNLVVYQGREWVAERIFQLDNANTSPTGTMRIGWFGVGSGGAPVGDPLNPTTPISTDTNLDTEVPFNGTDTNYGDLRGDSLFYKHPFDSVEFQQDASNNNEWLITKVTTTVDTDDCNGYNLNEAGLYIASDVTPGHSGPFYLFSKVTFPTIVKDSTRQLVFMWYLYC